MNKVCINGRLTKDPEVRYSREQKPIAKFSICYDRNGSEDPNFFSCTAFGKTAEFIEKYFSKGMKILICGRIKQTKFKTRDGRDESYVEIIADEAEFGEGKRQTEEKKQGADFENIDDSYSDELPFDFT